MTRYASIAVLFASLITVSGCLTVESKLDDKGGGSMTISYVAKPGTLEQQRKKMEGPNVKIVSAEQQGNRAIFKLTFDDVQKLSTSPFFEGVTATLADADGNKDLTVKIANKNPQKLTDDVIEKSGKEVTIALELPGSVVKSNAKSTAGSKVTWTFPTGDWSIAPEVTLQVTYNASAGGAAPATPATPATGATAATPVPTATPGPKRT